MKDELKKCPFCKGRKLRVTETPFVGFTVRCDNCLASGPYKKSMRLAIESWNKGVQR